MSSSITDDVGFAEVVAIMYPIQDTTPSIPPTIIRMLSCKTIGLHSESIRRYAYAKNAAIHDTKIKTPIDFRLDMSIGLKTVI